MKVKSLSRAQLLVTPWTAAHQAPPSMGFFRQEYWSGVPFPSLEDLPDPGIKPGSPTLQAETLPSEPPGKPESVEANKEMRFGFKTDHSTYTEKAMAPHSSTLAWKIPWTEEPGRLQSMG